MIKIFNSNSLEKLSDIFEDVICRNPLTSPLVEETILVQSIGMGRWLSINMSEKTGVWANFKYQYPNSFFNDLAVRLPFKKELNRIADKKTICWEIFNLLSSNPEKYSTEVSTYCHGNSLKTWQLSEKISDLYDQYSIYRTDMILKWNEGKKEIQYAGKWTPLEEVDEWQADLWTDAVKAGFTDRAVLQKEIINFMISENVKQYLPERISIFGVSTIPSYYLEIINAVSQFIPVSFFLLNPCRDFWYYDKSVKDISKIKQKTGTDSEFDFQHYETGNTLLSSFGQLGLEFQSMLMEKFSDTDFADTDNISFVETYPDSLLKKIKNDILLRTNRTDSRKEIIEPEDTSVQIHSCYSIQREIEILYDNLLKILNTREDIFPRDILVMTPDIESYAPYIEAVFSGSSENGLIPYSIADLNLKKSFEITETLMDILRIRQNRFTSAGIFDILQKNSVKQKFSISDDDIEKLKIKTGLSATCWGTDSDFRKRTTGIEFDENSWNTAVERFLSGMTVMSDENELLFGILPFNEIEDIDVETLGNFIDYIKTLKYISDETETEKTIPEWIEFIKSIPDSVFHENAQNAVQFNEIRTQLDNLKNSHENSSHKEKVNFEIIIYLLDNIFTGERVSFGFLDGRVTFCAVLPMRSIPFKVIAMLGLNDGVFPSMDKPLSFDLSVKNRKFGDRSRKNDDRYLFLENLISAGDIFYVSYLGRSAIDDAVFPPAVPVNELINYIDDNFFINNAEIRQMLVRDHSLHGFSEKYFNASDNRFFSYSSENCKMLISDEMPAARNDVFNPENIIPSDLLDISLADFISFFINPSRYFLQKRLGIYFESTSFNLSNEEPFGLEFSENLQLLEFSIDKLSRNEKINHDYLLKTGSFPPQNLGRHQLRDFVDVSEKLFSEIKGYLPEYRKYINCSPMEIQVKTYGKHYELTINADNSMIPEEGNLIYREKKWDRDYMDTFIRHAFCCHKTGKGISRIIDLSDHIIFTSLSDGYADKYLKNLAEIYIEGILHPVPFFLKTALEYSSHIIKPNSEKEKCFNLAASKYYNYQQKTGEFSCNYISYLFNPDLSEYSDRFIQLAKKITEPVLLNSKQNGER
ncbi:MAG: exodeoxyribonuclease V subunit gamma [Spirochaetes bacterium]|nr:exodeoxyribonuclease V subunit gamma [Spirochaetota bacterium]